MDDNAAGKQNVTLEQRVTLERSEDKLLIKIPGRLGKEDRSGSKNQAGKENCSGTAERCSKLTVILQIEDEEPIIKEALWDEACGQYVAVVNDCGTERQLEIWILTM